MAGQGRTQLLKQTGNTVPTIFSAVLVTLCGAFLSAVVQAANQTVTQYISTDSMVALRTPAVSPPGGVSVAPVESVVSAGPS